MFFYGFAGVEVFFALSAFLLSLPILKRKGQQTDWAAFASRRARRILPPAWGAMLLFILLGAAVEALSVEPFASAHPVNIPRTAAAALAMFSFWGRTYMNSSYWTMAVEVRWYLMLPVLIVLLRRLGAFRMVAATLMSAACYFFLRPHLGLAVSVGIGPLPYYLPLFGLGIAFAEQVVSEAESGPKGYSVGGLRLALAISALLVVAFTHSNSVTPSRIMPASLLGLLMLVSAVKDPLVRRVLSWKPLARVGRMSFSIYLTHEVVINFCVALARRHDLSLAEQVGVYFGLVPVCILLFAYGFHLVLERPFMQKQNVSPGRVASAPSGA